MDLAIQSLGDGFLRESSEVSELLQGKGGDSVN